jgi:hypothetical protein
MLIRYVAQFLVVLSPLLSGSWSFLDFAGVPVDKNGEVTILGIAALTGRKDQVEFNLRIAIAAFLFAVSIVTEWKTVGQPLERVRTFRKTYLDNEYDKGWKTSLGAGIRLNVMYLRKGLFFRSAWNKGFAPPKYHWDAGMVLLRWQGVAGQAFQLANTGASRGLGFGYAEYDLGNPDVMKTFRLTRGQLNRTKHVLAVLSIPMLRKITTREGGEKFKCVGMINVDAVTTDAAKVIKNNEAALIEAFAQVGRYLSDLS